MARLRCAGIVWAAVLLCALPCCRRGDAPVRSAPEVTRGDHLPNIILLTVDTLRADHTELYGYGRRTMPSMASFAKTAVVFDNAVVPRGVTGPSYASMLTGLYPFRHGVRSNATVLHRDLNTLPETLKSAGYHTAGFISNFCMVEELSGFGQGFDVYDDHVREQDPGQPPRDRRAGDTLKAILRWLDSDPPQPFLLFTNFIDPHGPYSPPEKYRSQFRSRRRRRLPRQSIPKYAFVEGQFNYYDYVDRYDAEIRYTDEALGILVEELKGRGLWDDALVVFTADHGESLGEHDIFFDHHYMVWEETMRVPLAIRLPASSTNRGAVKAGRVGGLASPMDLAPTILSYLELPSESVFDGRSLLPLMTGADDGGRALLLEFPSIATRTQLANAPDVYAVRTATHKLIRHMAQDTGKTVWQGVYHVAEDPLEQKWLPFSERDPAHRELSDRLNATLAQVREYSLPFAPTVHKVTSERREAIMKQKTRAAGTVVKPLTTSQIERLRSLGYAQ